MSRRLGGKDIRALGHQFGGMLTGKSEAKVRSAKLTSGGLHSDGVWPHQGCQQVIGLA